MLSPRADHLMVSGNKTYRLLAGQPSVYLTALICSSMLLGMGVINRVVCNISMQKFIIIIKKGSQCKAGREQLTPYQAEDYNPTTPTHRMKEEKTAGDKK